MRLSSFCGLGAALAASVLIGGPASAQKAKDTLRIAISEPFGSMSTYHNFGAELTPFAQNVYETLINYDGHKNQFIGELAKSFKRIDDKTVEYELRDDKHFHSGKKVTADDVVETINWTVGPTAKMTHKSLFIWVEKAEKMGPMTVRVRSHEIQATDLLLMSDRFPILNADLLKKDPENYGRTIHDGTGRYLTAKFDRNDGMMVTRNDRYVGPRLAPIKTVHGIPIPDRQTQIAEMTVGNIDVVRDVSTDHADFVRSNPKLTTTTVDQPTITYFQLDALNRAGQPALNDPRVRRAIFMAIDRASLAKFVLPGDGIAKVQDGLCFRYLQACDYSVKPPPYDPEGAKKLLAEAGYPNGFDLELNMHMRVKPLGEAVIGQLHKIGIRASGQAVTLTVQNKMRADGKMQAFVSYYPFLSLPDSEQTMSVLFASEARDYWRDDVIINGMREGRLTPDTEKRKGIYRKIFDRVNEMSYVLPLASLPTIIAHTKDVKIQPYPLNSYDVQIGEFAWQ